MPAGNPSLRRLFTASASDDSPPGRLRPTLLEELNDPSVAHILDRWSSMVDLDTMDESTNAPRGAQRKLPSWRWEALRTTFWLVPTVFVLVAGLLFVVTFEIDWAAYHRHLTLPFWIQAGSADAGRQVLIAIAAAVLTVVGVVFSITILALTLASQQFGPRMMRNFVRDIGNQVTLGVFVGTFAYSVLCLGSITSAPHTHLGPFVPRLSIIVAEALLLVDLAVLIYFIHHIAKSIQLPEVIAGIARDLTHAIDAEFPDRTMDERPALVGKGKAVSER